MALCFPVGDGSGDPTRFLHLFEDRRVVRDLHLVNRDAVGRFFDRGADTALPVFGSLVHHPGNQIDIDLIKTERLGKSEGAVGLFRAVRPAIHFDPETEPGHPDVP